MSSEVRKGLVFIISAPAGTGKTTLVQRLVQDFKNVKQSISFTTRQPRPGELDGIDYYFVSKEAFEAKVAKGDFLEHVELYGDYYGTSREWVENQQNEGNHVVLVIDTQGGLKLKDKIPAVYIFLEPPSLEELKRRLLSRKTEQSQVIDKRLACVEREMEQGKQYDYKIINDQIEDAYQVLKSILIAEGHRCR